MPKKHSKSGPDPRRKSRERSEDGVDLTLIRWMLSLTPAQRLKVAQDAAESMKRMRAERAKN